MFRDVIVIDDIFNNPDDIAYEARQMDYYDKYLHYQKINDTDMAHFSGIRTAPLSMLNKSLCDSCNIQILRKISEKCFSNSNASVNYTYSNKIYFHCLPEEYVFDKTWFHTDHNVLYAGVVYLSKNPPKNTGTILIRDDEEMIVENIYNRLVLYNSAITHSAQGSFGHSVYDARLTLTMFFYKMTFDVMCNTPTIKLNN